MAILFATMAKNDEDISNDIKSRPARIQGKMLFLFLGFLVYAGVYRLRASISSAPSLQDITVASQSSRQRDFKKDLAAVAASRSSSPLPLPWCNREQIRNGQWLPAQLEEAPYDPKEKWFRTCVRRGVMADSAKNKTMPWNTWIWQPNDAVSSSLLGAAQTPNHTGIAKCRFTEWSREEFCSVADGRSISFVGDSLTWTVFLALVYSLGAIPTSGWTTVCNGTTKLAWLRDNELTGVSLNRKELREADTLILNRGAHYRNDTAVESVLTGRTIPFVKQWQEACENNTSTGQCHFFWRTTTPGHPSCPKYRVPSTNTSAMEALIGDRGTKFDERGWWDFERQNTFMENLLAQNNLEATFMDGYDLLLTRPDLHIGGRKSDCLHYCLPGPPDVLNQVLLHELKRSWKTASNAVARK
jgi:hypothetical protein